MTRSAYFSQGVAILGLVLCACTGQAAAPDSPPDYHTDVAPILRDYCAGCHNDDDLEGELSVETFHQLMKGGENGEVIVPGRAEESKLVRVLTGQSRPPMPPKPEPHPSAEQIDILAKWIAAGAKGPAEDHSLLRTLTVPDLAPAAHTPPAITAVAHASNGAWLARARFAEVDIVDAATGKVRQRIAGLPGKVNALHVSPDDARLVTASGITGLRGEAALWDVASGNPIRVFADGHRDILFDAELSPDGSLLATAGYDRTILLRDATSGEVVRAIDGHNGAVFDLAFSPDGTILASASADETVKLWKVSTGERLDTLNQPQGAQFSLGFTPDGRYVVAAGADNRIRLWRLLSRDQPQINPLLHARFAHERDVVRIAFTPDGQRLLSASADRGLKLWTLPDLDLLADLGTMPDVVTGVSFAPDGRAVTVARMDGTSDVLPLDAAEHEAPRTQTVPSTPERASSGSEHRTITAIKEGSETAAQVLPLPAEIRGLITAPREVDEYRFRSQAGEEWVLEVKAARDKSPLDSHLEVLHAEGLPVERVVLQAVRDSWFTFRGKDSQTSGDFRLQNWREMELNEYLYANGEVVRLWHYPRGPDSGFLVYPGFGDRHTYFGTTALSHPLGEPCYIVRPLPPGSNPGTTGLPVFRLNYENDDDPQRRWGTDSHLIFTAPTEGEYRVRLTDVRGFGGADFTYALAVRPRRPDFRVTLEGANPTVSPGSGREFTLKAERLDGFQGAIRVDVSGLPEGFSASSPIVIEPEQDLALSVLFAEPNAKPPDAAAAKASRLTTYATVQGREVSHEAGSLGEIKLGPPAKLLVAILPDGDSGHVKAAPGQPIEFTISPGETITAQVKATRAGFDGRIEFGTDDSSRNLPHGVFIDNIGLNGLLIVEGQDERQFFITAAPWVPDTTRYFHLRAKGDGGQVSRPAILHVRRAEQRADVGADGRPAPGGQ